ncbi:MAG: glycoside hydrolase family 3 N-terminal domain-containing protein [Bacteroidota bacterium]
MMKLQKALLLLLCFGVLSACQQQNQVLTQAPPSEKSTIQKQQVSKVDPAIQAKVKAKLATLTLEDKVGEMTQLSIDMLMKGSPYNLEKPNVLDNAKLQKVLVNLKVGSILNMGGNAYTVEEWRKIVTTIQEYATEQKKSGIPVLYGIDAIHGQNYTLNSTLFPQQIGLAATWNPDLAVEMGRITAYEAKASYLPWNFSPVLDVGRNPLWPRFWETFGEDVHLASQMGAALIKGNQGDDISDPYRVAACMKHFLGYSYPKNGTDRSPVWLPERQMREIFLPTFEAAIKADAKTIMINSGELNGIPVHANKEILVDLLRDELGFEGLAVSDWEDIIFLHARHRISPNYKESIRMAINAGIDMSMVPIDLDFPVLLKELVEEGKVPMSRIDEAVTRILTLKYELGLFENPVPAGDYSKFGSDEHAQSAYNAATESITLLKNENNILPLAKNQKVLVTGPTANSMIYLNGGWSRTWQGNDPQFDTDGKLTVVEAIKAEIGADNVMFAEGSTINETKNQAQAAAYAQQADAAIVCIGESTYTELPGNITSLELPDAQQRLVDAIAATGKPVILVLVEGRPRIISKIEPVAKAIVNAYLPGDEGGRAIADILFGDVNPSGKLPFTYPKDVNDLEPYDHKGTNLPHIDFSTNGFNPQFEFGHGLSYTTFAYSNLTVSKKAASWDISVTVKNTGDRAGKEVVQLYVNDKVASTTPSLKKLRAFDKIDLAAGTSQTVTFSITPENLAFVGRGNKWITEPG